MSYGILGNSEFGRASDHHSNVNVNIAALPSGPLEAPNRTHTKGLKP
jgi:hypothetical protein